MHQRITFQAFWESLDCNLASTIDHHDNVEGKLVQNENYPILQEIIRLHNASMSVSEIAKRVNLNTAQIYGILRTLGGRK